MLPVLSSLWIVIATNTGIMPVEKKQYHEINSNSQVIQTNCEDMKSFTKLNKMSAMEISKCIEMSEEA